MTSAYEREEERKFIVTDVHQFWQIVEDVDAAKRIKSLRLSECISKTRVYRCFDTFTGTFREGKGVELYATTESSRLIFPERVRKDDVQVHGILEKWGASISARERSELSDCVLTIKIPRDDPQERDEYNNVLSQTDLYSINPNMFGHWSPFKSIREVVGTVPLQEVVRLYVQTHRFNLYQGSFRKEKNIKTRVALDFVVAISSGGHQKMFCELEVERIQGTTEDVTKVVEYFQGKYARYLRESSVPKWVKAMRLLRGESIY